MLLDDVLGTVTSLIPAATGLTFELVGTAVDLVGGLLPGLDLGLGIGGGGGEDGEGGGLLGL